MPFRCQESGHYWLGCVSAYAPKFQKTGYHPAAVRIMSAALSLKETSIGNFSQIE